MRYPIVIDDKRLQGRKHGCFGPWKKERELGYIAEVKAAAEAWSTGEGNVILSHTKPSIREMERRNPNVTKD